MKTLSGWLSSLRPILYSIKSLVFTGQLHAKKRSRKLEGKYVQSPVSSGSRCGLSRKVSSETLHIPNILGLPISGPAPAQNESFLEALHCHD